MTIAGIGAVTGYGWGRDTLWEGLLSGKSAARLYPGYGLERDRQGWVARVPEGGDPGVGLSRYGRAVQEAAREAVADAHTRGWKPGRTVGVLQAIVLGDVYDWRDFYLVDGGRRRNRDFIRLLPSTPISMLTQEFGFHGPTMDVVSACSSANVALITAKLWLDNGFADDVLVVASDLSAMPDLVEPFVQAGAAVTDIEPLQACRPFQEGSRGFGFGEAATAFVVTRAADDPYAAVLGGAMSNDGYHVLSVEPSHEHIFDCVRRALDHSGVPAGRVDYLNSHGSGTKQCDDAETALLERIFDGRPQVTALKPLAGHCQAAAAGVEIAAAAIGYEQGLVVAAPHVAAAHANLLDGPAAMTGEITIKTALGMGGNNSAVVLGPAD
ncbi:beta-ketoacyl synthase N-terminal-like domain-containing protein [Nocardia huaxiensis]|uniref:3-oxoacyl-ACP synthase n=1 Tax=Nocardia huaxiensis TaxID=2755382 RepID=A0A7D6VIM7_9NOCA|nr:beta-ketoacyl synthase N-terminal-like domain-containing protein [Nocardia huaxiensis]QLY33795.1 3-oxoacyl-ACP synthase [Nocardia huaxiensis]UFS99281.1 3-oxoacyl-ACP synthase [Nocardia huaxiensis]